MWPGIFRRRPGRQKLVFGEAARSVIFRTVRGGRQTRFRGRLGTQMAIDVTPQVEEVSDEDELEEDLEDLKWRKRMEEEDD